MNYRVAVRERVANNIATVAFLALEMGRDGPAVTSAYDEILLALSDNPSEQGESREGNERVLIVNPLTVFYEVFENPQVVLIYAAVYHPRQRL